MQQTTSPSPEKSSFDRIMRMLVEAGQRKEPLDIRAIEQADVDKINRERGDLDDGYDCKKCMNRGYTMILEERPLGLYKTAIPCSCMKIRHSIRRMKASGLEKVIRDYRFEKFSAFQPWQQAMKETAQRYLAEGVKEGRWLYMGGQPGTGKTHLCTAVAGKLLYEMPVLYVIWPDVSKKLKAVINDAEEYAKQINKLETISVLYIDDIFKPTKDDNGTSKLPSAADMKIAFEILNYRYINKLPTILSSEYQIMELVDMDEATGSRIAERCGEYIIGINRDRTRNQRLKGGTSI